MANVVAQRYVLMPVDQMRQHPDNPRRGRIGPIRESVEANGFYGAVVVQQSTGRIIVGNHRWLAAREAGIDALPALIVDCDDERAQRILLADNRHAELADWDDDALIDLLGDLAVAEDALIGTGFTAADLDRMRGADAFGPDDSDPIRLDQRKPIECPECGYTWRVLPGGEVQSA